jgi:hypothetical protein
MVRIVDVGSGRLRTNPLVSPGTAGVPPDGTRIFLAISERTIRFRLNLRGLGPYTSGSACFAAWAASGGRAFEVRPSGRSGLTGAPMCHTRQGEERLSCMTCMACMAHMGGAAPMGNGLRPPPGGAAPLGVKGRSGAGAGGTLAVAGRRAIRMISY